MKGRPFSRERVDMKLKILQSLAGPEYALAPGEEREFDQDEATRLVSAGIAEPVISVSETADQKEPEKRKK